MSRNLIKAKVDRVAVVDVSGFINFLQQSNRPAN